MRVLEFGDVALAVDEFGEQSYPPVLLIAGATQSMDWWAVEFCELLTAEGLEVVRYDQRDAGQSTTSPPWRPDYTGVGLAEARFRAIATTEFARSRNIESALTLRRVDGVGHEAPPPPGVGRRRSCTRRRHTQKSRKRHHSNYGL